MMGLTIGALLLAFSTALASARCASGSPPDYADIDRIVLIRCAPSASDYPCFRATLAIKGDRFVAGRLNALKGLGLRGQYTLETVPEAEATMAIGELQDRKFLNAEPVSAKPVIDGTLDVIAVRACGKVKVSRTLGQIDDSAHVQWIIMLDRLQASLLTLPWRQVSPQPDYRDSDDWYRDDLSSRLFES
jgi:hypothetical protein